MIGGCDVLTCQWNSGDDDVAVGWVGGIQSAFDDDVVV
jgi:hypothetical protein